MPAACGSHSTWSPAVSNFDDGAVTSGPAVAGDEGDGVFHLNCLLPTSSASLPTSTEDVDHHQARRDMQLVTAYGACRLPADSRAGADLLLYRIDFSKNDKTGAGRQ